MSNPQPAAGATSAPKPAVSVVSAEVMPPPPPPMSTAPLATTETAAANATVAANTNPPPAPVSELTMLRTHIQTLTDLNNRLQVVRHIPAQFLRPSKPHGPEAVKFELSLLTHGFKELSSIADTVRSDKVQDALKAARKSELADSSNLHSNLRRENLKRRRPPSPESPQPYREVESHELSFLPAVEPGTVPVRLEELPSFIRAYNKANKYKLHVVAPKKGRPLECPVILRFIVPNVVTIYLTLDHGKQLQGPLVVENATAIGSREQKPPHSQSDFMAFQQLSQQLAKVIRSDPTAPLQAHLTLLSSYERLFTDTCSNCQRVTSADGHVPPVVRKRLSPAADGKGPLWDVRHTVCAYEPPPPRSNPDESGADVEDTGGGAGGGEGGSSTI